MQRNRLLQVSAAGIACAAALFAADFWKTKDSSQWSSDEVNKILSDSPWAKEKTVSPQSNTGQRRGGGNRRGGFGFPGGGGIGFPGGGGGGYPGGGGGYPGGGGGGYPGGGGGGGSAPSEPMNLTIRWESAAPVQAALMRQGGIAADDAKTVAALSQKDYVITLLGYRMPAQRNRYGNSDDQNQNSSDDRNSQTNDRLRTQFLDSAQLTPKNGHSIYAEDVQFEGPNGSGAIRFLFPRTNLITATDKDVDFVLDMRGLKIEQKFHLADMQYEGKLAL